MTQFWANQQPDRQQYRTRDWIHIPRSPEKLRSEIAQAKSLLLEIISILYNRCDFSHDLNLFLQSDVEFVADRQLLSSLLAENGNDIANPARVTDAPFLFRVHLGDILRFWELADHAAAPLQRYKLNLFLSAEWDSELLTLVESDQSLLEVLDFKTLFVVFCGLV